MSIRTKIAIIAAKATGAACRITGKQGVTLAGQIARKIDPDVLTTLAAQVRRGIFFVCGTNGKTTANNLLALALETEGYKVICNHTGSNMLNGIVSMFVLAASAGGKIDADYACIEVDEASTRRVIPYFKPDYMVITNMFRDQLDRYGEIDITMDIFREVFEACPDMKLIANGDDALCAYLALEAKNDHVFFGVGEKCFDTGNTHEIREGRFCKRCGARLEYNFYHYSQIGDYFCPECGLRRPALDFDAEDVGLGEGGQEEAGSDNGVRFSCEGRKFKSNLHGFYNVYNILASYAAMRTAGIVPGNFQKCLDAYDPKNGRNEVFHIGGARVILNLAKNPAGFNQNIASVMQDGADKDIIIVINDNSQDGTDVSWLWDVDFDRFAESSIKSITTSGLRARDMRLRLKYVDIDSFMEDSVEMAIRKRLADGCGNLYVLVNYTALYSTHKILGRLERQI